MKPALDKLAGLGLDVFNWVDDRLHVRKVWESTAAHHVPQSAGSWFYVFGSATLLCFMMQLVTGIMLALVYVPSADEAYATLDYLTYHQQLGWFLRAMHYWGSEFMVGIMLLHMTQVYLFGAYKYPREITWLTGLALLALTLGLAFTGQVMRFDEDAYWGLGIGAAIMGRVPFIGQQMVDFMLGGQIIASETLSRFFALHVFVLPGAVLAVVSLHLRMVLTKGINEYPRPGMVVRRETYDKEYAAILKREGVPFFPNAIDKDIIAAAIVIGGMVACSCIFGPKLPNGPADPLQIDTNPRPDFWFLWIFAIASLMPAQIESFALLAGPVFIGLFLVALPFFNGTGEKSWRRRPIAVIAVVTLWVSLGMLTYLGATSPWSPIMDGWSSLPTRDAQILKRSPLQLQGAVVLQYKQCRNCHAIDGLGGERGPNLTDVGMRLTKPQLTRQVVQGGGNMPAYGQNLKPEEVEALVDYMTTLVPEGVEPARDFTLTKAASSGPR